MPRHPRFRALALLRRLLAVLVAAVVMQASEKPSQVLTHALQQIPYTGYPDATNNGALKPAGRGQKKSPEPEWRERTFDTAVVETDRTQSHEDMQTRVSRTCCFTALGHDDKRCPDGGVCRRRPVRWPRGIDHESEHRTLEGFGAPDLGIPQSGTVAG